MCPAEAGGEPLALVYVRDVSEVRRLSEEAGRATGHDPVTGLLNRCGFVERAAPLLQAAIERGRGASLAFLDLDNFKAINDGYGHAIGDALLCESAKRLLGVVRSDDVVARLSGDEFAVLLPGLVRQEDARMIGAKLMNALAQPYALVDELDLYTSASVGVAIAPDDGDSAEDLLRCAEIAMYEAKNSGRGVLSVFNESMAKGVDRRLVVHSRLLAALQEGGLNLHYQPQVDVQTGQMISVEALLRWNDRILGPVSPVEMIPVAEASGLILRVGDWVMEQAFRQASEWHRHGLNLRVAINLSALQLKQRDLPERIGALLRKHRLPPEFIELEITESEAVSDPALALSLIQQVRAMGITVALDDFGTGHSSLACLRSMPVQRIKVDRSFLARIPQDPADAALVRGVIALANQLHLAVIAEGVEKPEQLDFVRQSGCEIYQGWLYGKAVPADEITRLALKDRGSKAA